MLFKREHIKMILGGRKTQTRRTGKRKYRVGSLQPVTETWFQEPQIYIRITRHYRQRLGDISSEEAKKEGYRTIDGFKAAWIKLHGTWNPELIADAYEFEISKKRGRADQTARLNSLKKLKTAHKDVEKLKARAKKAIFK